MRTLAVLLLLAAPTLAEVRPGFSLYGHVDRAESIVLATLDTNGEVVVLDLVRGMPIPGGTLTIDPPLSRLDGAGEDRRAFLFLTEGYLVGGGAGVAWIRDDRVELLAAHPSWLTVGGYRPPTVAQLRESVQVVAQHIEEVRRIAKLLPGRDRVQAMGRLLSSAEGECGWYVFRGDAISSLLDLRPPQPGEGSRRSSSRGYVRTYVEEVSTALSASIDDWAEEERRALMDAIRDLPPGTVRREHIEILLSAGVPADSGKELTGWFLSASELREKVALARALRYADPASCRMAVLVQINAAGIEEAELAEKLLGLLELDDEDQLLHFTVRRLARRLLAASKDPKWGGLGRLLVFFLDVIHDDADRGLLLSLARSSLACRFPALDYLRTWAGKDWEAADLRWDQLLTE